VRAIETRKTAKDELDAEDHFSPAHTTPAFLPRKAKKELCAQSYTATVRERLNMDAEIALICPGFNLLWA
jgi:hypothetical protein